MYLIKRYLVPIVLALTILLVWVGTLVIKEKVFVTLNPNANTYIKPLKPSFDESTLEDVSERTEDSFPVLPKEFLNLKSD